ncbi:MAG: tetratricopeptide repeat protein [Acidimicrobiia bacterium]
MPRYSDSPPPRRGRGTSDGPRSRDPRDDRDNYEEESEWGNTTHTQRRVTGLRKRSVPGVEALDGTRRRSATKTKGAGAEPSKRLTLKGTPKKVTRSAEPPTQRSERASKAALTKKRAAPKSSARTGSAVGDGPTRSPRRPRPTGTRNTSENPYPTKRKRTRPITDPAAEILKLAPRRGPWLVSQLHQASDAFAAGRDRDAIRLLRPVRSEVPQSVAVRELLGVALYRVGNFRDARAELETFADLTGSVEQHPLLMDIARSQGKTQQVVELWGELTNISPSAALVTEGRIVYAGMLADAGDLAGAIAFIEKGATQKPGRIREHHIRRWYVLGDLYDRSGNVPRARAWFDRVAKAQSGYADVAERLSRL